MYLLMSSYGFCTFHISLSVSGVTLDDVLVGAPLYMDRELESKPREVGRVYLYLQEDVLLFSPAITLTGTHVFGRYGSAIAPLGDINQDGYLDVAVGAPFAGDDRGGLVFIYNGERSGLRLKASQVLSGAWASSAIPAGFGFTLRGDSDLDNNQYPVQHSGALGSTVDSQQGGPGSDSRPGCPMPFCLWSKKLLPVSSPTPAHMTILPSFSSITTGFL
ncbi:hypothetical protein NFI96_031368 [Prochilodus magdalenae]|nr:hypothetical protein NFI96_031368 [Prochilodus magdalenae]